MSQSSAHSHTLRILFWESTVRCNLSCAHCRRIETSETDRVDLTAEQAKRLFDQTAQLGQSQGWMPLMIFSGGEPLCRSDLFDLIENATARNIPCALATNGTLIDETIAEKIKAVDLQRVAVSLDGATPDVHNQLRRLDGAFESALSGIHLLRKHNVPFQINMTLTRSNVHQLDDMFALANRLGAAAIHLFMLVPVGCGGEYAKADRLSANDYEDLFVRIAHKQYTDPLEIKVTCAPHYERVVRQQVSAARRISKGCLAGTGVLFVGHTGTVFPCGYLPVDCGNILHTPLAKIWNDNPDLARMRDTEQLKGKCGRCEYQTVCGGCRGRAFAATGDYMQAEPLCIYDPNKSAAARAVRLARRGDRMITRKA